MTDSFSAHYQPDAGEGSLREGRTALLVVDMLNDFLEPGGAMVLPGGDVLYEPINRLTDAVRRSGGEVVWVCDRHETMDDREFDKRTPHCLAGTWGAGVVDALHREERDHELPKRRYSAFFMTDLDLWLRERNVRTVITCGVVTNICVRSTVHDAFFRGYEVVVATDCCAATGEREQASTLYDIETHFGRLATSDELVRTLAAPASAS